MILIINQQKKKGKNLVRPTTFEVVSNGNGPLGTHSLSLSLFFSHYFSFSLSLSIHFIFLSLSTTRLLSFCTRLMLAHSRWDWVKTFTRGDSSGSMRSNNAAAENIHSCRRLPAIDVTRKMVL
jgi:hypothetical protein